MKYPLFALCIFAAMIVSALADEASFQQANKNFAAGDFKAAISAYEAEVGTGQWSSNLFYDLGNAYFRVGDLGRAILNYKRALQLDRQHPEAAANLRVARGQARSLELTRSLLDRVASGASATLYSVVAAVSFWLAVFLVMIRRRGAILAIALIAFLVSGACAAMCYLVETGTTGSRAAVVVAPDVQARVATADTARSIQVLPPGSEVLILQRRGDWSYAVLPNDQHGWIPDSSAEKIRL